MKNVGMDKSTEQMRRAADLKGAAVSFWTLGRKVVATHLAHVILLIVLLGCGSYWIIWGYIREKQPKILKTTAQMIAGIIEEDVTELELLVERMIKDDAVVKYKTSYNLPALERHLSQYSDRFLRISYFNAEGLEVFRLFKGHSDEVLPEKPDRRFIPGTGIVPNEIHIFTPQMTPAAGEPMMELAYRHVDFFDESLGSIVVGVPVEKLSTEIMSAVSSKDSTIVIVDGEGRIAFSTEMPRPAGLTEDLQSIFAQNDVDFGRHELFGKDSFVARARVPNAGWSVMVAQPKEIYFADVMKLTRGVLFVLLAMLGGSACLAFYISRSVVRPVLLLNENISLVSGSEDLTQRLQWTSRDEFGMLADSYNKMLVRLHEATRQMVKSQQQASYLAFHDSLTDLPNRMMLMQTLEGALAQAGRDGGKLAVLFIDLDDFKLINDTMGHEVGDQLLRKVADRLRDAVRKNDYVSRPGGDEFIVFMVRYGDTASQTQGEEFIFWASTLAQRLIDRMKEPFLIQDYETYVSVSIGISIYPDDAPNSQVLQQHADCALARAKDLGGGQAQFYSPELSQCQQNRMSLATRLHKASENNEFVLFYQPVVHLADGRIVGAEALLRWQTNEGIVSPGEFIPLAEETGLILPIGNWVINEACRQLQHWRKEGVELPSLSINLSARQFWHGNVASQLLAAIGRNGLDPEKLELEVTESSVMKEPLRMEEILKILHEQGFGIALDDFGTGYSSLSRLKHLPIGKLKIDKSFVDGTPLDGDNKSIVTAIVQLSQSLGIDAQAEGIETAEQWSYLRELGCKYGQGYFFSPPVSAAKFEAMLRQNFSWKA